MKFKLINESTISEKEAQELINKVYNTNNSRYDSNQFTKLIGSNKIWEMIDNKALAVLDYNRLGLQDYYLNEIQSFEKGYGKKLLQELIKKYDILWFIADPSSDSNLVKYYEQFGLNEFVIEHTIWNKPVTAFYQGPSEIEDRIKEEYNA